MFIFQANQCLFKVKKMKSIKDMGKTGILENREEVTEIGCLTRKSDVLVDGKSYRTFVLEHYGKSKLTAKLVDKFREDVANGKIKL